MRTLNVRQIALSGSKHVTLHRIPFPEVRDKSFYRSAISYSAFFESTKRRNWSDRYLFIVDDPCSPIRLGEYEITRDAALPVNEHADLLSFFKAIGYDRTAKKFLHVQTVTDASH